MNKNDQPSTNMRILMVDDNSRNLNVLFDILKGKGYELSAATSGEMALKAATNFLPDLILLDIMMPGINGFETCTKLKSDPVTENIPVIFLSAKVDTEDIVKGFQVGGVDYITKPFNHEEFLVRIRTQLLLREKTKKLEEAKMEISNYAKELEKSNEALTNFSLIAAHDLNAPLRSITNLGQFLIDDYGEILEEEGKDKLEKMRMLSIDLSSLIDSLLNFSMITKDAKPFVSNDLNSLVQKVVDSLDMRVQESSGKIKISNLPILDGETYLLTQLFQNLISNSLKFHVDGTPPLVEIYSESLGNGKWAVIVKDHGIGFEEKFAEEIFIPLKRLVPNKDFEGSGIGLATCKKIVDYHKGDIIVLSKLGEGSTFKIILPEKQI
jgi:two-component system, sensor histidine kinase and response regulator